MLVCVWRGALEKGEVVFFYMLQPMYCHCLDVLATLASETALRQYSELFIYLLSVRFKQTLTL